MRRFPLLVALLLVLAVAACGGAPRGDVGLSAPLECVPFARALSGINLQGDAPDWWRWSGRYVRGRAPEVGSVMAFARTPSLPRGHLAVVSLVRSRREILVTQANWVHHHISTDQLVRDVSLYGDWSLVRVWWPPTDALGSTAYPVLGFIYSGHSTSHDHIVGAVQSATQMALDGGAQFP